MTEQGLGADAIELLTLATRADGEAQGDARFHELAAGVRDWQALLDAADSHGVLPLLNRRLEAAAPDVVPPSGKRLLSDYARSLLVRCRVQTAELLAVPETLSQAEVPALTLSGSAAA